ncbi:MAG: M20/M25/M40 family metallo-hydrolase, partial [Calditrichaeota bacterium]
MKRVVNPVMIFMIFFFGSLLAQENVDLGMITRIKEEGLKHSQVMEIVSYLTDVYGPRLTGSPNLRAAQHWCVDKLSEWGLQNAHLEEWGTFGKGWEVVKVDAEMVSPVYMPLIAYPKAWTPGTDSTITGTPHVLDLDEEDLEQYSGKLSGAIVMVGSNQDVEPREEADFTRHDEEKLQELAQAPIPGAPSRWAARRKEWRARRQKIRKLREFLTKENVAVVLEASSMPHGTIRVLSGGTYRLHETTPSIPTLVVAPEHYNRIARLIKLGKQVELSINIQTQFFEDDTLEYNVIAEIPGTDRKLKKELVMLGGHLDSWHAGTGASDNAAGCAVMMEAVRILKTIGVKPRRTIRIALWSGEEQGLLGSRGYVKKHFMDPNTKEKKPEYDRLSAYYNLDNGSGKIRGIYLQENDACRPIFEAFFQPFHDMGASTVTIRNTSGTDHLSFDRIGLPGFQFIQDPLEYFTRTWHTNMDVYEHVSKSDLMQASVIVASIVYHTAMRDEKLPR